MNRKLFLLFLLILPKITGSPSIISSISYSPQVVLHGSQVSINVEFTNTTPIESVSSFYCKLQPEYLCHIPALILHLTDTTYSGSFVVQENASEVIGFDVIIRFINGSRMTLPKDGPEINGPEVIEPIPGAFYYRIDVLENNTASTSASISSMTHSEKSSEEKTFFMTTPYLLLIPIIMFRKFTNTRNKLE